MRFKFQSQYRIVRDFCYASIIVAFFALFMGGTGIAFLWPGQWILGSVLFLMSLSIGLAASALLIEYRLYQAAKQRNIKPEEKRDS